MTIVIGAGSESASDVAGGRSLRGYFALVPCALDASNATITAQTSAIQSAINSCQTSGYALDIGSDAWAVNDTLSVTANLTIRAVPAAPVCGPEGLLIAPWMTGGRFVMTAPDKDVIFADGADGYFALNLYGLGIMFSRYSSIDGTTRVGFNNTGHGIRTMGLLYYQWEDVVVLGHDGDHYASHNTQSGNAHIRQFQAPLGGGIWYQTLLPNAIGGNVVLDEVIGGNICRGTADAFHNDANGGVLNLIEWHRPSCYITNYVGTSVGIYWGITQAPDLVTQRVWRDVGQVQQAVYCADLEPPEAPPIPGSRTTFIQTQAVGGALGDSVALGEAALAGITSGDGGGAQAVGIGHQALSSSTTSAGNTAVGYRALKAATSGGGNVAVGRDALKALTTGGSSAAVGYQSMENVTTALGNTALGFQALRALTTGPNNVAVGSNALSSMASGGSHIAVGQGALQQFTGSGEGAGNTALGHRAMYVATTGDSSVAVGYQALVSVTTGGNNTAVGFTALNSLTTGSDNTGIGLRALYSAVGGQENVAVGRTTLHAVTSGSYNTAIGSSAGLSNVTTASYNTFLGYGTGASGNLAGTVAIGADNTGAGAVAGAANEIKLGTANHRTAISGRLNVAQRTPSGSADAQGIAGDIAADDDYVYVKASTGWKRSALATF